MAVIFFQPGNSRIIATMGRGIPSALARNCRTAAAIAAGSVGPWERGGISPFQLESGRRLAESEGHPYDANGASVA